MTTLANKNFLFLWSESNSPYYNLALEEHLLKHYKSDQPILFLWQNDNTIVIGRNQNTYAEINSLFVKEHKINVVRRMSGGGAVYQDLNNICFTLIVDKAEVDQSYKTLLSPIITFLNQAGVPASFKGRNDIVVDDDKKISGNAMFIYKDKILIHGTLLYDVDMSVLSKALKVDEAKLASKGIKSHRARVANIKDYLSNPISCEMFLKQLCDYFINDFKAKQLVLSKQGLDAINERVKFYQSDAWNYNKSRNFSIHNKHRYDGGTLTTSVNVDSGIITDIEFNGDYLSVKEPQPVIKALIGAHYNYDEVKKCLITLKINEYFGSIKLTEILQGIFQND